MCVKLDMATCRAFVGSVGGSRRESKMVRSSYPPSCCRCELQTEPMIGNIVCCCKFIFHFIFFIGFNSISQFRFVVAIFNFVSMFPFLFNKYLYNMFLIHFKHVHFHIALLIQKGKFDI